jgi:hypothetical protein
MNRLYRCTNLNRYNLVQLIEVVPLYPPYVIGRVHRYNYPVQVLSTRRGA